MIEIGIFICQCIEHIKNLYSAEESARMQTAVAKTRQSSRYWAV